MSDISRQLWPGKKSGITKADWEKGEDERMAGLKAAANREPYNPYKGISTRVRGSKPSKPSVNPQNPMDNRGYLKEVSGLADAERREADEADKNLYAKIQNPSNYTRGGRRSKRYRKTKKNKRSRTKRSTKSKRTRSRK